MNKYYLGEKFDIYLQKKGKGKLPLFHGNGERVITIYSTWVIGWLWPISVRAMRMYAPL